MKGNKKVYTHTYTLCTCTLHVCYIHTCMKKILHLFRNFQGNGDKGEGISYTHSLTWIATWITAVLAYSPIVKQYVKLHTKAEEPCIFMYFILSIWEDSALKRRKKNASLCRRGILETDKHVVWFQSKSSVSF